MTAPHIGNTGVNDEDAESRRIWVGRLRRARPRPRPVELARRRARSSDELRDQGVVGISGIDTRALTRHLRERGAMRVGVSSVGAPTPQRAARAGCSQRRAMAGADLAGEVSTAERLRRARRWARSGSPSPRSTSASRR